MKATVQEISTLESKLKKAAQEIQKLNEQVAEGSQFFEKFENLLKELPDSIVSTSYFRDKSLSK